MDNIKLKVIDKKDKIRGFSLLEMIIYIAVLVFLLTITINILFTIVKSQRSFNASKNVENSAIVAMERVTREIREAQLVNTSLSTFGVNPSILVLESTDANGNAKTVEFYLSTNNLKIKENGIDQGSLTRSNARVINLTFTLITTTGSRAIRTQMTIESGTSNALRTGNFYSTTVLRGSM